MWFRLLSLMVVVLTLSDCWVCDNAYGYELMINFIDENTGEDLFFGNNALFKSDTLFVTPNNGQKEIARVNDFMSDSAHFVFYPTMDETIIFHYPDNTNDTVRVEARKRQCDFFTKVFFNGNLILDEEDEHFEVVVFEKNDF